MKKTGIALALLLCLLLAAAGCGKKKGAYDRAEDLLEASSFSQAEDLFSTLGDFKDAAEKQRECKYLLALSCAQAQPPDVVQAVRLLEELGGYRDAVSLKESLQKQYYFPEYGYRIPSPACIMTDAKQTESRGKDKTGAFRRCDFDWSLSVRLSAAELSDRFMQWIECLDGVDGVEARRSLGGTFILFVDDQPFGTVSTKKTDTTVIVSVVLYDEPME